MFRRAVVSDIRKVKNVSDENRSCAMNPEDIENTGEMYFEQHYKVIDTSASIEHFVIKQKVQSKVP